MSTPLLIDGHAYLHLRNQRAALSGCPMAKSPGSANRSAATGAWFDKSARFASTRRTRATSPTARKAGRLVESRLPDRLAHLEQPRGHGPQRSAGAFDFPAYLDFLERHHHNFIRLWAWDSTTWDTRANGALGKDFIHNAAPLPWLRTGPGKALDGKPKFDLTKFEPEYFERLRSRVAAAGGAGSTWA
jgi:hypothetical protein